MERCQSYLRLVLMEWENFSLGGPRMQDQWMAKCRDGTVATGRLLSQLSLEKGYEVDGVQWKLPLPV